MTSRRQFILSSCKVCLLMGTAGTLATLMESCKTIKSVSAEPAGTGRVKVPLTSFAESNQILVRAPKSLFDILVNKKSDGSFVALLMQCTHEDQPLTATSTVISCASHGSRFDLDGNVLLAPATRPLIKYQAVASENDLLITLKAL